MTERYYGTAKTPFAYYQEGDPVVLEKNKTNTTLWTDLIQNKKIQAMTEEEINNLGEDFDPTLWLQKKQEAEETERLQREIAVGILNKQKKQAIETTVEHLIKKMKIKTLRDTEEILYQNEGTYHFGGESYVKEEIEQLWRTVVPATHDINEIIGHIQRRTYIQRKRFQTKPEKITLENGVYNTETQTLEEHDPQNLTLNKIPVKYNPKATCPQIEKFLSEALHPDDIPVFYELAGYCLTAHYKHHKAFLFIGGGGNGKTIAINLLTTFIGEENIQSIPIQTLEYDRFAKARLYGKLANICDDLPNTALKQTGIFKQLTGNSPIDSDQKNKGRVNFRNHAKLIFATNEVPEMKDNSTAFFDRWIILNFPNRFRGTEREDLNLLEKITTPEEMSGFLGKAIEGLVRLGERGGFSMNKSTEETEALITRLTNTIKAFADDCLISQPDSWVPKETVYQVYVEYCKHHKLPVKTNTKLTQELKQHISFSAGKRSVEGKKGVLVWEGLSFSKEYLQKSGIMIKLSYISYFSLILQKQSINIYSNIVKKYDISESRQNVRDIINFFRGNEKTIEELIDYSKTINLDPGGFGDILQELKSKGLVVEVRAGVLRVVEGGGLSEEA